MNIKNDLKNEQMSNLNIESIAIQLNIDDLKVSNDTVIEIIRRFNCKVEELVLSGNTVDTGFLLMSPKKNKKFHKNELQIENNATSISIQCKSKLSGTSSIDIKIPENRMIISNISKNNSKNTTSNKENSIFNDEEAPCGIAFRRWLCKS